MFFLGQYQHNLDDKGRLMIPARFREMLDGGAYLTQGLDQCLMVMTGEYFRRVYDDLNNNTSLTDPNARSLRRLILANAFPVEIDKVGRVLLPQMLREFAGVNGEAVIVGQGEYFEIWSPVLWAEQVTQLQDTEANNQRFAALKLTGKASQ